MNRLRDFSRLLLLAAALGLAGFWIITGSGPFGWLDGVQPELLRGRSFPVLSGLFALVCAVVPAGVLGHLLRPKVDAGPIEALRADPVGTTARGPVVLGVESLIGWPKAGVVVTAAGIELHRGGRLVFCPRSLFEADGSPVTEGGDSIVVPVRPDRAGEVELRVGGKVVARGTEVSTSFFRWRGPDQVRLTVELELPIDEFARLLAVMARDLPEAS